MGWGRVGYGNGEDGYFSLDYVSVSCAVLCCVVFWGVMRERGWVRVRWEMGMVCRASSVEYCAYFKLGMFSSALVTRINDLYMKSLLLNLAKSPYVFPSPPLSHCFGFFPIPLLLTPIGHTTLTDTPKSHYPQPSTPQPSTPLPAPAYYQTRAHYPTPDD